jgi:hypothetical protein
MPRVQHVAVTAGDPLCTTVQVVPDVGRVRAVWIGLDQAGLVGSAR